MRIQSLQLHHNFSEQSVSNDSRPRSRMQSIMAHTIMTHDSNNDQPHRQRLHQPKTSMLSVTPTASSIGMSDTPTPQPHPYDDPPDRWPPSITNVRSA